MQTFIGPRISKPAPSMSREKLALVSALLSLRNHRREQGQRDGGAGSEEDYSLVSMRSQKREFAEAEKIRRFQGEQTDQQLRFLVGQADQDRQLKFGLAKMGLTVGREQAQDKAKADLQTAMLVYQGKVDPAKIEAGADVRGAELEHTMGIHPWLYAGGQAVKAHWGHKEKMAAAGAGVREAEVKGQADKEKQELINAHKLQLAGMEDARKRLELDQAADPAAKLRVESATAAYVAAIEMLGQAEGLEGADWVTKDRAATVAYDRLRGEIARALGPAPPMPDPGVAPPAAPAAPVVSAAPPPPAVAVPPRIAGPVAKLKAAGMQWIPVQVWEALRQDGFTDDEIRQINDHLRI